MIGATLVEQADVEARVAPDHGRSWPWLYPVASAAAMSLVAGVGLVRLREGYWNDEGISVGIASQPLSRIPALLRLDSAPPGYYLILHVWMAVFGRTPAATHLLSLVAAVAAVATIGWSARRLCGDRVAVVAVLMAGVDPFLWWYGTETRMYSLVVLVTTAAGTLYLDALKRGGWGRSTASVLCASAATYLHDWAWFVVAALVVIGIAQVVRGRESRPAFVICFGLGCVVLYLPWFPSLMFQVSHTGAPWASGPRVAELISGPFQAIAGGAWGLVAFLVGAAALTGIVYGDWQGHAGSVAAVVVVATSVSWVGADWSSAWVERYLAILVGPLTVVAAAALIGTAVPATSRLRAARLTVAIAVISSIAVVSAGGLADPRNRSATTKSNVDELAGQLHGYLRPGDVVLATDTSQLPVIAYYLGGTLRYGDPLGLTDVTYLTDWDGLEQRLGRADPSVMVQRVAGSLAPGQHLLVVGPTFGRPGAGYGGVVASEARALADAAKTDPELSLDRLIEPPVTQNPIAAYVYTRL